MNILLDTHVLMWWLKDARRLGPAARHLIRVPGTSVCVSAASIWEIGIKTALLSTSIAPLSHDIIMISL